jgi:betaine-aldehyde dehydrogenase
LNGLSWIAGKWRTSASGRAAASIDPATGQTIGLFDDADSDSVHAALAAAADALYHTDWCTTPRLRASVLLKFADLLEASRKTIAELLTAEHGKPISQSLVEVDLSVSELRYYAGLARNIFGRVIELESGLYSIIGKEPAGVTAIIVPWNAPIILLIRSLAPALAAGCTCVICSSSEYLRQLAA